MTFDQRYHFANKDGLKANLAIMSINRLISFIKSRVVPHLKRLGLKEAILRFSYRKGLPRGVSPNMVESFLCHHGGGELVAVQYCHMSAWKNAGSYKLVLRCRPCRVVRLVFKNAKYSDIEIPALMGLPVMPGAAEYFFFTQTNTPAYCFLPEIYHAEEVTPKAHYQYLMQDLSVDHRTYVGPTDLVNICEFLPRLQEALLESAKNTDGSPLNRYDRDFDDQLLRYAHRSLDAYRAKHWDPEVERLVSQWAEFADHYDRSSEMAYLYQPLTVVHGDFNTGNMMIHRRDDSIRVFDLEWAGWGLPHGDLASALIGAPPDVEESCLASFHRTLGLHTLDEDRAILRHARLQRAVLNASFVAKQLLSAQGRVIPDWFAKFVSDESQRAFDILECLRKEAH